jgi:hypothetical protein
MDILFTVGGDVCARTAYSTTTEENLMNRTYMWIIGFLASVLMAVSASAGTANFTLEQTALPITRTYPGVDASILGIQTGMTAAQAEAIAERNYPEQSPGAPNSLFMAYTGPGFTGNLLKTKPLVPYVTFSKLAGDTGDHLTLHFTTPALGGTVYAITRDIDFLPGTGKTRVYPPMDAIRASLIKKYGPPSYQTKYGPSREHGAVYGSNGGLMLAWIFSKDSRLTCQSESCVGPIAQGVPLNLGMSKSQYDQSLSQICGTSADSPAVFKIVAKIEAIGQGQPDAVAVKVWLWDAQACVNDGEQAWNQFAAAIASLTKPKPQASLPGASESVPPGSGPLSFYGDIGNSISHQNVPLLSRPSSLMLTEDGSVELVHLHWSDWGKGIARATGAWSASDCTPSCAAGKVTTSPARLTLWSPGLVGGHWVYRCFQIDPQHPKRDSLDRACIRGDGYDSLPK